MKKLAILLLLVTTLAGNGFAQKEKIFTEKGNTALKEGNIEAAKEAYKKALDINPDYKEAVFNLGNAYQQEARSILKSIQEETDQEKKKKIYQKAQEASKAAAEQYKKAREGLDNPEKINKAEYNLGNAQLMSGELDKSIEAYKDALRKMPGDEDARYNLAYAQHMKKKQEQQQKQQNKDQKNQDQKDQKQDNQDQKKEDQKKQDQQKNKDQDKKDQQKQQQKKNELSKEEAKKMLQALNQQEKDVQDKLKKKKAKAQPIKIEKNW